MVQSSEDILVECGRGESSSSAVFTEVLNRPSVHSLDKESADLLELIDVYPESRNELIARSGVSSAKIAELLLMLELEGLVEMLPGDEVRKIQKES